MHTIITMIIVILKRKKNYPGKMYEDAAASQYLAGAAYHNYGGNREELLNIHKAYPEKGTSFSRRLLSEHGIADVICRNDCWKI